ncbi:CCA tRNA nucleotidyltransferase [Anaerobacillus alkaliphilus]|uniref:CCA tRNA nucleotidyltransferase n=1 Tax=Anaerobacillus alkaliphilus TaxID=1548597 RepID=A0A4Q0VXS1_9BACI|nr:CCA tRNA nucleotidyltransferase [Anaerobacillus alkaliphilus]RXJ03976.1 CCA tRNA nucleotidyltransferase [Anaerobacillus alkaliphilus]
MDMHFLQQANYIIQKLKTAGYEAYIVGGAVRDFLLNREIHDIDIATSAPATEVKVLFPKTIDVAIAHGTVVVRHQGESFEVTSYRGNTLFEDLRLRDFTMNAMGLSRNGDMVDPFRGKDDINQRMIRCVENPSLRFQEDPLRMLRAIRFVSQLGFAIEDDTLEAIKMNGFLINHVAIERVSLELEKIWSGAYVKRSFGYLNETNLLEKLEALLPLRKALLDEDVATTLTKLTNRTEVWTFLLFISNLEDPEVFLENWKQPKKIIVEVASIIKRLPSILESGFTCEDLYYLGLDTSLRTERVRAALLHTIENPIEVEKGYRKLPIKDKKELDVRGDEIALLLTNDDPKSKIGQLITAIELAVVNQKVENTKSAIIKWLREEGLIDA